MGLTRKTSDSPTGSDTLITTSLRDTKNINEFILREDSVYGDFLLEKALREVNLSTDIRTSVNLHLHDVGLLHAKVKLLHLGVGDDTHNLAELGNTLKLGLNVLSVILSVLLSVLGVRLSLRLVPVLVATTLELLTQMLREDGGQCTETAGGFKVSHNTNDNHGRGFDDRNGIDNLTLVHDGTRTVNSTDNVGHTGLVGAEGSEVGSSRRIGVLWEGADATRVVLGTLLGEEPKGSTAGGFEFTVRHR
mmetsp:Transcript_26189/g.54698  ORF Transcript_26189/g.54698 Transcript_26189/m.54698 type:complete len:248 (+) Transcript_26189:315-1058(+)